MNLIEATKKAILNGMQENKNLKNEEVNDKVLDVNRIKNWAEKSVKWLVEQDEGCCEYKLDNDLSIFCGWSDGYDPADDGIKPKEDLTFRINIGIKGNHEYMKTDYDWLVAPYDDKTGDVWDTDITVSPEGVSDDDIQWLINQYKEIKEALDEGNIVLENYEDSEVKEEARREPEINNKVAPRDRRPSFERGSPNYTSPDEITYKYNLEYAHNAEPKRYRVRSRQQAQNRENVGELDFAGTDDMMNFEKTGFADEYDMNKTSREYRDLKKHIKANQQVLDNHYKNPEKNPNLNVDGIKKDITNDKRRATRIYNKAMNKSIESKQLKTEATLDLDDMYDEYKKAYNKDLDTKRVPCVIARDVMLSGWGGAEGKNHYQVVLCADTVEARNIEYNMKARAKQEQLANVRTSIGIQLPRNASVAYTVGRYAPAWNMGDSWYESRYGKVEEGRYKLDVVKYNMLHDKFKNDKRSYDELSNAEKEELNTYRDLTKKVYNSTRDHKDIKSEAKNDVEVKCINTYFEDDEEYWSEGNYYPAKKLSDTEWKVRTNLGTWGRIGDAYTINDINEYFEVQDKVEEAKDDTKIAEIENQIKSKLKSYKQLKKINKGDTNKSKDLEDEIEDLEAQLKSLKSEAIETQDIQAHTTAGDTDEERAYYGKNLTKRNKIRSLDQAKRNLDRANNGDERVQAKQVYDQVSYDNLPDTDLQTYKFRKDMASIHSGEGPKYNKDLTVDGKSKLEPSEHNDMVATMWDIQANNVADKIRAKHIKKEARNPENDKVNAMIRTTLNGSTKYVKDLEDLGFVLDKYGPNGKVSTIHHKDNDEYLYRGKMMGLDKNADLYNYLTKKRPTDWDDRTNSGFEVQKNMSSEKDLADGGYSSNGFTSTVGKSIPKRFKTNKSSIVVTEPYGSKKVKQYKELNKNIAYKKDDIADLQNDVTSMQNDIAKKQNDINSTQDEINQMEKDKKALLTKQKA